MCYNYFAGTPNNTDYEDVNDVQQNAVLTQQFI